VLAGDIDGGAAGIMWARDAVKIPVVYVPGNHEFYGHRRPQMLQRMREVAAGTNVHLLDRDAVVIDGVRFLGATLWTDYKLQGERHQDRSMREARLYLNDHSVITEHDPLLTQLAGFMPAHALREHEASVAWLREQMATPFAGKTVVVSHHGPNEQSVAARFREDELSPAYSSKLPHDLFDVPALWCHGHVHDSFAYEIGSCLVVTNPRGYPIDRRGSYKAGFENLHYLEDLVVEI
jgi:Icc-related predicted phosphoesterase